MKMQELLQKRAEHIAVQRALLDKATGENRDLSEQEAKDFDAADTQIKNLDNMIKREKDVAAREADLDQPITRTARPTSVAPAGDKLDDGGFKDVGELLSALKFGDPKGRLKDLSTTDVGIEIPPAFATQIMRVDAESEIVMPRANVIPAGSPPDAEFTVPYFVQGDNGANGGVQVYWSAEGNVIKDTNDPDIKDLTLKPFEASALATVNNKTLQNWQAAGGFVQGLLQQAWASARDYKFLRGTGAGSPLGILKAPGRITLKRKTAATVTYEDAVKMTGRLLPEALSNAVWVASITLKPVLMLLVDGAGRYIFVNGDATKGIPDTLAGIPIKWTGKTPVVGNEGDLMLVDFRYYLIKPGSGPFVAISEHAKFAANKTVFRIVANIDGQPWVKDPLKLEDGVTTVSPYVILQ